MSQARYPKGSVLECDMSELDTFTLEHEIELCRQNLHGVWLPQYNTGLKGILNQTPSDYGCSQEAFDSMKATWQERLRRAETELLERNLLK